MNFELDQSEEKENRPTGFYLIHILQGRFHSKKGGLWRGFFGLLGVTADDRPAVTAEAGAAMDYTVHSAMILRTDFCFVRSVVGDLFAIRVSGV